MRTRVIPHHDRYPQRTPFRQRRHCRLLPQTRRPTLPHLTRQRVNGYLQVPPLVRTLHTLTQPDPTHGPTPTRLTNQPHPQRVHKHHPLPHAHPLRRQRRAKPPCFPCACSAASARTAIGRGILRRTPSRWKSRCIGRSDSSTPSASRHHAAASRSVRKPCVVACWMRCACWSGVNSERGVARLPPRVRRVSSSSPPVQDPVRHLWMDIRETPTMRATCRVGVPRRSRARAWRRLAMWRLRSCLSRA
jgi:hypothetical protein